MFRPGNNVTTFSFIPLALPDAMTCSTHTRAVEGHHTLPASDLFRASLARQPWEQVVTSHVVFSAGIRGECYAGIDFMGRSCSDFCRRCRLFPASCSLKRADP